MVHYPTLSCSLKIDHDYHQTHLLFSMQITFKFSSLFVWLFLVFLFRTFSTSSLAHSKFILSSNSYIPFIIIWTRVENFSQLNWIMNFSISRFHEEKSLHITRQLTAIRVSFPLIFIQPFVFIKGWNTLASKFHNYIFIRPLITAIEINYVVAERRSQRKITRG